MQGGAAALGLAASGAKAVTAGTGVEKTSSATPWIVIGGDVSIPTPLYARRREGRHYGKTGGRWNNLFRAVDKHSKTIDLLLRRAGGTAAEESFFRKSLSTTAHHWPKKVTLDGHKPSHLALRCLRRKDPKWVKIRKHQFSVGRGQRSWPLPLHGLRTRALELVPLWDYNASMRIIALSTLRKFMDSDAKYGDVREPLLAWYRQTLAADWAAPADVKAAFGSASILKDGRVVFNIAGNKYRLVVWINYPYRVVYVRFVGTHRQYDRIDAQSI